MDIWNLVFYVNYIVSLINLQRKYGLSRHWKIPCRFTFVCQFLPPECVSSMVQHLLKYFCTSECHIPARPGQPAWASMETQRVWVMMETPETRIIGVSKVLLLCRAPLNGRLWYPDVWCLHHDSEPVCVHTGPSRLAGACWYVTLATLVNRPISLQKSGSVYWNQHWFTEPGQDNMTEETDHSHYYWWENFLFLSRHRSHEFI